MTRSASLRELDMLKLFTRYASVGVINTLLHWVVFSLIYTQGQTQSLSNFPAFCVAVTFSFFVNAKWTFNSEATVIRYMTYVFFMGAMAYGAGWCADRLNLSPFITLTFFSFISLVCGFIYSKFIVLGKRNENIPRCTCT